jgi:hypothetical protein
MCQSQRMEMTTRSTSAAWPCRPDSTISQGPRPAHINPTEGNTARIEDSSARENHVINCDTSAPRLSINSSFNPRPGTAYSDTTGQPWRSCQALLGVVWLARHMQRHRQWAVSVILQSAVSGRQCNRPCLSPWMNGEIMNPEARITHRVLGGLGYMRALPQTS